MSHLAPSPPSHSFSSHQFDHLFSIPQMRMALIELVSLLHLSSLQAVSDHLAPSPPLPPLLSLSLPFVCPREESDRGPITFPLEMEHAQRERPSASLFPDLAPMDNPLAFIMQCKRRRKGNGSPPSLSPSLLSCVVVCLCMPRPSSVLCWERRGGGIHWSSVRRKDDSSIPGLRKERPLSYYCN